MGTFISTETVKSIDFYACSGETESKFDFERNLIGGKPVELAITSAVKPAYLLGKVIDNRPTVERVIFNDPATIVYWNDGTKTVVKAKNESFDPEKGLAMCFTKKVLGNTGRYYKLFKEWIHEEGR